MMDKAGFLDELGRENVCAHVDAALERAREILGLPVAAQTESVNTRATELEDARREMAMAFKRADEALGRAAGKTTISPRPVGVSATVQSAE